MFIVSYGNIGGQNAYIVKNKYLHVASQHDFNLFFFSWGAGWGVQGYVYVLRGQNTCGIATDAIYPTV